MGTRNQQKCEFSSEKEHPYPAQKLLSFVQFMQNPEHFIYKKYYKQKWKSF